MRPVASSPLPMWHLRKGDAMLHTETLAASIAAASRSTIASSMAAMVVDQALRNSISRMPSSAHTASAWLKSSLISSVITPSLGTPRPFADPFAGR